jgi:hypothetical protein
VDDVIRTLSVVVPDVTVTTSVSAANVLEPVPLQANLVISIPDDYDQNAIFNLGSLVGSLFANRAINRTISHHLTSK